MDTQVVSEHKSGERHNWLELAHKAGIKIGLWEWDVLTNSVTGSDESYRQFGFTHETFSGRLEDLVGRVHPQDRAGFSKTIDKHIVTARFQVLNIGNVFYYSSIADGNIVGSPGANTAYLGTPRTFMASIQMTL